MTIPFSFAPVNTQEELQKILSNDFPRDCRKLPIEGGWGYTKESAIRFVRSKFPVPAVADFVPYEYLIANKIAFEELIIFRTKETRFAGIKVEREWQRLCEIEGRIYDWLSFRVTCWPERVWDDLKHEWEAGLAMALGSFDIGLHNSRRNKLMETYCRELWFDITDVFKRH